MTQNDPSINSKENDNSTVLITRRRWDYYFIPGTILVFLVSIISSIISGNYRVLSATPLFIVLWLWMRFETPSEGTKWHTIRGTPGLMPSLIWFAGIFFLMVLLIIIDSYVTGHRMHDPMKLYHWIASSIIFALILSGVYIIDRRYRKKTD